MTQPTQAERRPNVAMFDLDNAIGFVIEVTEQLMKRELRKRFKRHGFDLTPYQWIVLYRLMQKDGLNQAEIAELTTRDRPNITRIVNVMEQRGLIERRPAVSDRRVNRVFLTNKGRELFARLPGIVSDHLERATRNIPANDLLITKSVLRRMSRNLQAAPEER